MFNPKYTITNKLLENIKKINSIISALNQKRFPKPVLVELLKRAEAVSSYASTSIEGNPLPLTEVKNLLKTLPENINQSEREVLNYNKILKQINKKTAQKNLSLNHKLILNIQKELMKGLLPDSKLGKYREEPVFVNNPRTGQVVFLPPDARDVLGLISNLQGFVHKNEKLLDPLLLAGLFHKQFVLVHPFVDGNGRTTRLLTKILLANMGLNTFNLFSFENYYNNNVTRYFEMVGERGNYYELKDRVDFTAWLDYFTVGILEELLRVKKELDKTAPYTLRYLNKDQLKILNYLEEKGTVTTAEYCKISRRAKATRTKDFEKLLKLGLIRRKNQGRATYYVLK